MGMTNAEKQAAWRARRDAELKELRAEVARLRQRATKGERDAASAAELEELQTLRTLYKVWSPRNAELAAALEKAKQENKKLKAASSGGWSAPKSFTKGERYRQLMQLCHPDKHNGSKLAADVTQWLNKTRPRPPRNDKLGR